MESNEAMTQKQARKDSKVGKQRLKGRQAKTKRKDSKAGKERLKTRQAKTPASSTHKRQHSKYAKIQVIKCVLMYSSEY
jgi:hypothetical protein